MWPTLMQFIVKYYMSLSTFWCYCITLLFLYTGAMKEGIVGFFKGTGKGVLGLVFKPTGGLIDFTSATLLAVQR